MLQASIALDAKSIVVVKIESAKPSAWTNAARQERVRQVDLELTADRVLKGAVSRGGKAKVTVEQREATGRFHAVAGPWSGSTLERGRKLIVFSSSAERLLERLLAKDAVLRVGAESEAVDVVVILDLEKSAAKPSEWDGKVNANQRPALGALFADYLAQKLPDIAKTGESEWAAALKFIEDARNSPLLQRQGGEAAVSAVLMLAPAPGELVPVTTRFIFRLLANHSDPGFVQRALDSWIPNLVGLTGSEKRRGPAAIFSGSNELGSAQDAVQKLAASAARDRVLAWFRQ